MSVPSSAFSILLFSADPDLQAHFKRVFKEGSVTVVKDIPALSKETARRSFDAVIVESKSTGTGLGPAQAHVDPSSTLVVSGSRTVLKRASRFMQMVGKKKAAGSNGALALSLEDYLEWKMGDFVKGMRNGSGRDLHPMLISAVERPLITLALEEMRGNQIQAAELLGLNRNTLRKKIAELHIQVKRRKNTRSKTA